MFLELYKLNGIFPFQYLEPVDGAAVDQRWKLAQAVSEGVPDRTKGHNDVQVLPAASHKEGKQSQRAQLQVSITGLGERTHCLQEEREIRFMFRVNVLQPMMRLQCQTLYLHDLLFLIDGKQVRNFSCVQDAVHVLQESLIFDLSIC